MEFLNITNANEIITPKECFNWCSVQHVTGYSNIETIYVMFVAGALLCLIAYETLNETENLKKYAHHFVYYAKILLYIFFFAYFVILKMRLYYYFT